MKKIRSYCIISMLGILPLNALGGGDDNTDALIKLAKENSELISAKNKAEEEKGALNKEISELEKRLKSSQADNEKLQKELDKQIQKVNELNETKKTLNAEKKSVAEPLNKKISQLQTQIDSLNNIINGLQHANEKTVAELTQKLVSDQAQKTDSLEKEIVNLRNQNAQLQEETNILKVDIDRKTKHLKELETFEIEYLARLSSSFDSDWANRSYANMDEANLMELKDMSEKYKDKNPKINEASVKFAALQKELSSYNEAKRLLNEPYDQLKVAACIDKLNANTASATSSHQKELNDKSKDLKDYRIGLIGFQALIKMIDEQAAEFSSHAASYNGVKKKLEEQDPNLNKVKSNPWLSVKYQEYLKELAKNCKEQGEARNAIMKLTTK